MDAVSSTCFAPSYRSARERFLELAGHAGGRCVSHRHPVAFGPDGMKLYCDVASFGREDARRLFIIISGTHGQEGAAGSAAQIALLTTGRLASLPADVGVLMVHALNPWGFAHGSRTTENNVDLNRNFIDWNGARPPNASYAPLHPLLCPDEWTEQSHARTQRAMDAWIAEHGRPAFLDALMRGQYEFPDGLSYGGRGPEWPNNILMQILDAHAARASRVAIIEWHTGLGEHGEPFFLCFNTPGSAAHARCLEWWGVPPVSASFVEDGKRPQYTGLVFQGVHKRLGHAEVVGGVIEFGTRPVTPMIDALRIDRWLKFSPRAAAHPEAAQLRADMLDAFCPVAETWRTRVAAHAARIQLQTLDGLIAWQ